MRSDPVRGFPLSDAQTRMWISQRAKPDDSGWNMAFGWVLEGELDTIALREAAERLVERHAVLGQRFAEVDGTPAAFPSGAPLSWHEFDLASVSDDAVHDRARALLDEATNQVFDLSVGPPMRLLLIRERPTTYVFYVVVHHIVFDGQSAEIFTRDLARLYVAARSGAIGVAPLESSYAEYAAAERFDSTRAQAVEYWTHALRAVEPAELPVDFAISVGVATMGTHSIFIPPQTLDALRAMASQQRSTLFMVALAGLQVTLSRFTGSADVVVGTPVGTRDRAELDELIGLFFNPVLIPGRVEPHLGVDTFIEGVRVAMLDAFQYANAPFNEVVAALNPSRSKDGSAPLFQSWLEIETDGEADLLALPGITATPVAAGRLALRSDLDVTVQVRDSDLVVRFNYRSDKFRSESIERIGATFAEVMASMAFQQGLSVGELGRADPLRDPLIREICLGEEREVCSDLLSDIFRGAVEHPDRLAVVQDDVSLSYRDLLDLSRGVADALLSQGLGAEAVVAIYMARCPEMVAAMLGTMLAGCAYLPLDPDLPSERLITIVEDAAPRVTITDRSNEMVTSWARHTMLIGEVPGAHRDLDDYPGMSVDGAHLAYVMYTSGSTGKPKGVMIERAGLTNFVRWCARGYDSGQGNGAPVFSSVAFDAVIPNLFGPLVLGEAVHLMPSSTDLGSLGEGLVRSGKYNYIKLTPQHLDVLATQLSAAEASALCGRLVVGADRFPRSTLERWRMLDSDTPILNEYGPTEITVANSTYEVSGIPDAQVLPIGRPIPGTSMWILDEELRPVPLGGVGEICIGGVGVARGYLRRPSATAAVFVPDPFSSDSGARIYRTGDYGRVGPDGQVEFRGRRDHQLKVRGFRIEPAEIERALTCQDEVVAAFVTGHTPPDGITELIAYVVTDAPIEDRTLRRRLRDTLPHYQVPSRFLRVPEIPLTPHGKVDTARLRDPGLQRDDGVSTEAGRVAETMLLQRIWADLLGVDDVEPQDNFFELGGYSLLALKLIARVEEATEKKLTLREVFESPTLGEMAGILDREQARVAAEPHVGAAGSAGVYPLTPDQTRILYAQEASGSTTQFNLVGCWTISGPLDVQHLDRAIRRLVDRHAALRTRIELRDGAFVQVVGIESTADVGHVDLTSRDIEAARGRLRQLVEELDRVEFALGSALVRIRLVQLASTEHAVVVSGHHVILDGWSMGLLIRDLGEMYAALDEGRDADLPALPRSFPELASHRATTPASRPQPRAAAAEPVVLPTDHPRRENESSAGARVQGLIPPRSWAAVRDVARAHGTTPFVVLLACAQVMIAEYASNPFFTFGFSEAGRDDPQVHDVVGPFFKQAVGVADLRGEPTFAEAIDRAAAAMIDARARLEGLAGSNGPAPAPTVWVEMEPEEEQALTFPKTLRVAQFTVPTVEVKNDLVLSLRETELGVEVYLAYRASLFEQRTAEGLRDRFIGLADVVASSPSRRVAELTGNALPSTRQPRQLATNHGVGEPGDGPMTVLIEVAADLLGVRSISGTDNFFDLGGDSINAIAFVAKARQHGIRLTVRDLVGRSTFAELAAATSASITSLTSRQQSLVELRAPAGGRRLVCIQPSGGTVPWYFTLAEVLPEGCGLSAFLASEDRWLGEAHVSVEQMAEAFADELCSEPAAAPFTILGWSASGVWAVELARQLRGRGVPVGPLILVEPALPDLSQRARIRRAWSDFSQAADLVDVLCQQVSISSADRTLLQEQLKELIAGSDVLAESVASLTSSGPLRMSAAMELAQLSYVPRPYEGTAELVIGDEVTAACPARPSRVAGTSESAYLERWRAVFPVDALNVHRVNGDHMSMLQDKDHAAQIARIVSRLWNAERG